MLTKIRWAQSPLQGAAETVELVETEFEQWEFVFVDNRF